MGTKMYKLEFPFYVRFLSAFQTLNDMNLTRSEQAYMARRWRKTHVARRLTGEEKASLIKWRMFKEWDAEYQKLTRWDNKMDFLIERMQEDPELYLEYVRWSVKTGRMA